MNKYFDCKVMYQSEDDKGRVSNVTESYLVDAISYGEAEKRTYEEMESIANGEFNIKSITKTNIDDVFLYEDSDLFHKCKIVYQVEEESGKSKKITQYMLVTAKSVEEAFQRIHESLNNMLVTFQVPEVKETAIMEVFFYQKEDELEVVEKTFM